MVWRSEWAAIAARIDGLMDASRFLLDAFGGVDLDAHQSVRLQIMPEARGLGMALRTFHHQHRNHLPDNARRFLETFLQTSAGVVPDATGPMDLQPIVAWQLFRSQFEYALRDSEQVVVGATERAFAHLQRLIVADPTVGRTWQAAFK